MYEKEIEQLQKMIDESSSIVFFGGAGVSTESNIPDFRSADGIYHQAYKYSPEQVVSHSFFMAHTDAFFEFYKEKMMILDAKPNPAHLKLAELEKAGKLSAVVTQNIDGLHQAAGSKVVYELHGSIMRNYCMDCHTFYDAEYVKNGDGAPRCEKCGGLVKPDVVLYEEGLDSQVIQGAIRAITDADMLIMVSDGISDAIEHEADGRLRELIARSPILNPKEMADYLLRYAINSQGGRIRDDMTVLTCCVKRRAEG